MVKENRRAVVIGLSGLVVAVSLYLWTGRGSGSGILGPAEPARGPLEDVPRIDLARIDAQPEASDAGKVNIFDWIPEKPKAVARGAATPPPPPPTTMAVATPPPEAIRAPPAVPPLNVKYVGTLDSPKTGLRVAILITDKQEILTGQVGELVANRFKILKIGYESVDIQDVGSDQVRRIPFRGN